MIFINILLWAQLFDFCRFPSLFPELSPTRQEKKLNHQVFLPVINIDWLKRGKRINFHATRFAFIVVVSSFVFLFVTFSSEILINTIAIGSSMVENLLFSAWLKWFVCVLYRTFIYVNRLVNGARVTFHRISFRRMRKSKLSEREKRINQRLLSPTTKCLISETF